MALLLHMNLVSIMPAFKNIYLFSPPAKPLSPPAKAHDLALQHNTDTMQSNRIVTIREFSMTLFRL